MHSRITEDIVARLGTQPHNGKLRVVRSSRNHLQRLCVSITFQQDGKHPMGPTPPFPGRSLGRLFHQAVLLGLAAISSTFSSGCAADMDPSSQAPSAAGSAPAKSPAEDRAAGKARAPAVPRKIIYDARVELLVDSLTTAEQAVLKLIKEHGGFLAESDQSSVTSTQRRATWRVRVPVDQFDKFLAAVTSLGELRRNHVGSQDVTEEFFDIEARVRNKQEEEKRLLRHLSESTGKLEDILAVERELSRVRGEVEQMQGRLRFLANQADLSTITIEATEWKDYKPPVAATFQTQLGRTFSNSVDNLFAFGKAILVVAVALAPWLPLIVLGVFVARWLVRLSRRSSRTSSRPATPAQPGPS